MEAIWQWGINLIITIQQVHGPVLDNIFRIITFGGEEQFYLVLLPLILWCFDYSFGAVLAVFFMLAESVNFTLKELIQHPRPFDLNPSLKLSAADGYGMPSGHAQLSLVVWIAIADRVKKTWFWVVAVSIVILISFSRIYLGVHFPTDVFAGLIVGGLLLVLYFAYRITIEKWVKGLNTGFQLLLAIGLSLLFLLPHASTDALTGTGAFLGLALGLIFKYRYLPYSVDGPWWQRALRFVIGVAILFALYLGLKAAFPRDGTVIGSVFRVVRYAVIGGWITIGAPWLFRVMRLAKASA
jgi:membrane-associated phospholipid phosphatase